MIIDTGILVAAIARRDARHADAKAVLEVPGRRIVPEPVAVESAWFIGTRHGARAEAVFARSLTSRSFAVEGLTSADRERVAELLDTYADARIGYVDASVVAIAERLEQSQIATFDRRDFSLIRPKHVSAFTLVP